MHLLFIHEIWPLSWELMLLAIGAIWKSKVYTNRAWRVGHDPSQCYFTETTLLVVATSASKNGFFITKMNWCSSFFEKSFWILKVFWKCMPHWFWKRKKATFARDLMALAILYLLNGAFHIHTISLLINVIPKKFEIKLFPLYLTCWKETKCSNVVS